MKDCKWILTSDLVAFITNEKEVYLSKFIKKSEDKKKFNLLKLIGPAVEIKIDVNSFNLKLSPDLSVFIKSDLFPEKENYYKLMNFYSSGLGEILTQVDNDKGDFLDNIFEAVFSDDNEFSVFFVNKNMSQYEECSEELRRRLNCELYKKTKKWIPGHRYDSLTKTIYYLGEVKSRKGGNSLTKFLEGDDMVTAYLYVEKLTTEKTISDVINSMKFGDDSIKVSLKQISMVDSGEVLENDFKNFQDYWDILIENTIKSERRINKYGNVSYNCIENIFSILSYQSNTKDLLKLSDKSKNLLEGVLRDVIKSTILYNWDLKFLPYSINSKLSLEDNVKNLSNLTLLSIKNKSELVINVDYYSELFNKYEIKLEDLCKEVLSNWDENSIYKNFDDYLNNFEYVINHSISNPNIIISKEGKDDNKNSVKNYYGDNLLSKTIVNLFNDAKKDYGKGITSFNFYKNKSNDNQFYIKATITLFDLVNYFGGVDNIPEELKRDILIWKFVNININISDDLDLV